jgi:hypothetical protein
MDYGRRAEILPPLDPKLTFLERERVIAQLDKLQTWIDVIREQVENMGKKR